MTEDIELSGFAESFLDVDRDRLPVDTGDLRRALIADTIRMAIKNAPTSEDGWSRIHTNSLRNWVERKLEAVLIATGIEEDPPEDIGEDWFQSVLSEGDGPNLRFLGEVLKLDGGYYAPAPTRVVFGTERDAILISGRPTSDFTDTGLDIRVSGITRHIADVDHGELDGLGIPIQPKESYVGIESDTEYDTEFLSEFINSNESRPWDPHEDWVGYLSQTDTFNFWWGEDFQEVLTTDGRISLWKSEEEFYKKEYWLRINPVDDNEEMKMIKVPNRLFKYFCLIIDSVPGKFRTVSFEPINDEVRIHSEFNPPAAHWRWLDATGARYEGYNEELDEFSWLIDTPYAEFASDIFESLAINVERGYR